jgi:signal transduction histidine kinase
MVPVDMNDVVEGTLRLLAPQIPAGIDLRRVLAEGLPQVSGDPELLRQVLINLIMNAVQAMPQGGVLTITTASKSSPLDLLGPLGEFIKRALRGAPSTLVSVSDTGPGIPPESLKKIFIPFFTSKKDGTGLGLAICHKIVESHDGVIEVTSEPGSGSTFLVKLPALTPQKSHAAAS